jgi:hypothetical protein
VELFVMVLVAFPLGFLVPNRLVAYVAYIAVHAFVFVFQSLTLLIEWIGGDESAFGPYPDASGGDVAAYGVVNLVIYAVGLGLVYVGHRVGARRRSRAVHLDPVAG